MGSPYIISAILLWSSLGVVVRLSGVPVHILMFYSSMVAVLIQSLILMKKKYRVDLPKGKDIPHLFILGVVSLVNTFTFFYAFKNTTVANAVFTHYIAPVVVAFLSPVFLKERITKSILLSIVIASAGLWILLGISFSDLLSFFKEPSRDALGIMSGLLSGFVYAIVILLVRVYAQSFNPVILCFSLNLIISLLLLPFVRAFPIDALLSFLIVGVVHSTVAPILYFKGMSEVRATKAAILGYIEPVGAIIFSMIFLSEYPRAVSLIGGALIILSGYIVIRNEAKQK